MYRSLGPLRVFRRHSRVGNTPYIEPMKAETVLSIGAMLDFSGREA
jgi:hypothetical protein